jgi:hypothetical protein
MFLLDWRFFPVLDSATRYVGVYDPALVAASVVIETLARDRGAAPVGELLGALEADLAAAQSGLRESVGVEHV